MKGPVLPVRMIGGVPGNLLLDGEGNPVAHIFNKDHAERIVAALNGMDEALALLREVACSGRDERHPAIGYHEVQIDVETLESIDALLARHEAGS